MHFEQIFKHFYNQADLIALSRNVSELNFYCKGNSQIMITKSNTLIEAGYDLTYAEHDLITLAVNKLHKEKTGGKQVIISAKEFAAANNVSDNYAYQTLKEAANTLGNKKLKFTLYRDLTRHTEKEEDKLTVIKPNHSHFTTLRAEYNWLQGISYQDQLGYIILHFSDPLAFLIERTNEAYTKYDYVKTIEFTGCSSKRLYELVKKWQNIKKIPTMTVFEWKEFFGVADKYPQISEFKRRVLEPAIEQINKQGEFLLTLKTVKTGRIISHFEIAIKFVKSKAELADSGKDLKQQIKNLTPIQADKFSKLLANDSNFGSKFARSGETMNEFINRLSNELQRDPKKIANYLPFLKKCGFKS